MDKDKFETQSGGHSKEGRDNDPQVIVGLAVTRASAVC